LRDAKLAARVGAFLDELIWYARALSGPAAATRQYLNPNPRENR
jgi:hypothetical protein